MSEISDKLKKSLLISTGMFLLSKKKVEELVKSLEESGFNKENAESTANEILLSARKHKKDFLKKLTTEIKKKTIFATKDEVRKIEKVLEEISSKIDS